MATFSRFQTFITPIDPEDVSEIATGLETLIDQIGGFKDMGDLLADDFWLGNRIAEKGYKVILSTAIVDHCINYGSFLAGLHHQISWMKNTRCASTSPRTSSRAPAFA